MNYRHSDLRLFYKDGLETKDVTINLGATGARKPVNISFK